MKYSQQIGILATIILIVLCFLPWSVVESQHLTISGFEAKGTNFGRPGLFQVIFAMAGLIMFAVPKIWAKRTNVFLSAITLAWSIRNYILVSTCLFGECPVKQPALYGLVFTAAIVLVMALFPKIELPANNA